MTDIVRSCYFRIMPDKIRWGLVRTDCPGCALLLYLCTSAYGLYGSGADSEQPFIRQFYCVDEVFVRSVGNIDESGVIVFAVVAPGSHLVGPLEPVNAGHCRALFST
jgi:hypothetical protein